MGYLAAVLLQLRIAAIPLRFIGCFACFGVACFLLGISLAKDIEDDIKALNANARKKRTRVLIPKQLNELIRFTNVKRFGFCFDLWNKWKRFPIFFFHRLFFSFVDIYQIILLILVLGCTGAIILALLTIQIDLAQVFFHPKIETLKCFRLNDLWDNHVIYIIDFRPAKKSILWCCLNRLLCALVRPYYFYSLVKCVNSFAMHTAKSMTFSANSVFICCH